MCNPWRKPLLKWLLWRLHSQRCLTQISLVRPNIKKATMAIIQDTKPHEAAKRNFCTPAHLEPIDDKDWYAGASKVRKCVKTLIWRQQLESSVLSGSLTKSHVTHQVGHVGRKASAVYAGVPYRGHGSALDQEQHDLRTVNPEAAARAGASLTCTKWLAVIKAIKTQRNRESHLPTLSMTLSTHRQTEILAKPIPILLTIWA